VYPKVKVKHWDSTAQPTAKERRKKRATREEGWQKVYGKDEGLLCIN
jgi:hypothetical protein